MIEKARALLEEDPICDHCLGRRFAELSWGLSNRERGHSLRVVNALLEDKDFEPSAMEECWVCDGVFTQIDEWVERCLKSGEDVEFSTFVVGTRVPPLIDENELFLDEEYGGEHSESFKSEFNREVGKRLERELDAVVDFERPDVVFIVDLQVGGVELQVNPLFVYGRYRKLERGIPQTEWPCRECRGEGCSRCDGTGYMYSESVEELIRPMVLEASGGEEMVFHGAGREDVDALMLGDGRPFVVEVKEPKRRSFSLEDLEGGIDEYTDGKVEVHDLVFVDSGMVERVKKLDASKRYRLRVAVDDGVGEEELREALSELEGVVKQFTPQRVEHRRAQKEREREVFNAEGRVVEGELEIEVYCEGGLYVKELITGDGGRTEPSLSDLLGRNLEVLELDVLAVEGDFLGSQE